MDNRAFSISKMLNLLLGLKSIIVVISYTYNLHLTGILYWRVNNKPSYLPLKGFVLKLECLDPKSFYF